MDEKKIARINELAHKKKAVGLTPAELAEQAALRQEFLAAVRANLKSQLSNVDILEADGSVTHMSDVIKAKETMNS